mgnify:CR=1 FL=1
MKLSDLSKIGFPEIKCIFYMLASYVLSRFVREDNLWLVCERGTDARDNGLWMYRFIKQIHPEVNVKYIITPTSEDRERIEQINRESHSESEIVAANSLRHYLLMWKSKYMLSTHLLGCLPYFEDHPGLKMWVVNRIPTTKMVWLQHGVIKDDLKIAYYGNGKIDLFICGAKSEYDFVCERFGYPPGVVKYTGLARYDGLHGSKVKKNQILLMPTWRRWLNRDNFDSSEYLKAYLSLLNNEKLYQLLEKYDCRLIFYPHYEVQPYIGVFRKKIKSPRIMIADKCKYDVQTLLKESALLITDYSSVLFDFAYQRKPLLFYQFDQADFYHRHYKKGYFRYETFGPLAQNEGELLTYLETALRSGMQLDANTTKRMEDFFPWYDTHNCERIYQEIIKL